MKTTEEK